MASRSCSSTCNAAYLFILLCPCLRTTPATSVAPRVCIGAPFCSGNTPVPYTDPRSGFHFPRPTKGVDKTWHADTRLEVACEQARRLSACVQPADDTHTREGIFRLLSVGANACQRLLTAAVGLRDPAEGSSDCARTSTSPQQYSLSPSDQLAAPDALTTLGHTTGYYPGGAAVLANSKHVPPIGCPQACGLQAGADVMWQAQADNDGSVGSSLAMSSLVSTLDMLALEQSDAFNGSGIVWGGAAGDMVPPAVAAALFDTTGTRASLVSSRDGPAAAMGLIAEGPGASSSSSNTRMGPDSSTRLQHYGRPKGQLTQAPGPSHMVGSLQQGPLMVSPQQPANMAMANPQLATWRPAHTADAVGQPAVALQQHLQQQACMLSRPPMGVHPMMHQQAQQGPGSSAGGMQCGNMAPWQLSGIGMLPAPGHMTVQQQAGACYTYIPTAQPARPTPEVPLMVVPRQGGGAPAGYVLHRPVLLGSRASSEAAAAGLPLGGGPAGGTRLFVGNLGTSVDELRLVQLFAPFGDVVDVQVMWNTKLLARGRRVNREFAFISFSSPAAASQALAALHGSRAPGLEKDSRGITVEYESGSMLAQLRSH